MSFADLKPVRLHLQTHVFYLFPEFQDDYASEVAQKWNTPNSMHHLYLL